MALNVPVINIPERQGPDPPVDQPEETYMLRAAARMHEEGRLVEPQGDAPEADYMPVWRSIFQQESSSGTDLRTSSAGAIGPGQIMPGTFSQWAKPGEDIHNYDDNIKVSQRIVKSYHDRWGGDPERVAVAYYSGPGNVAPLGSPTPWKRDIKSRGAPSVSQYVSQVTGRMDNPDQHKQELQTSIFDWLTGGGKAKAAPTGFTTDPSTPANVPGNAPFPTEAEGKFAREVGIAYGKAWESYVDRKVARVAGGVTGKDTFMATPEVEMAAIRRDTSTQLAERMLRKGASAHVDLTNPRNREILKTMGEMFSQAAVAVGRSGLATLGFDPSKSVVDAMSGPSSLAGGYASWHDYPRDYTGKREPQPNTILAPSSDEYFAGTRSSAVHESIHRGIFQLIQANPEAKKLYNKIQEAGISNELMVRHLMLRKMGDPEAEKPEMEKAIVHPTQREEARGKVMPKVSEWIDQLDQMAAEEVAKRRPRGPQ